MQKLIITACISSYEANKTLNPAVPYTVEEFVREAKSAYEAGAAIVHLHPREDDGALTQSPERYKALMNAIVNECPGVILQPATGGDAKMSVEERFQPLELDPDRNAGLRDRQLWRRRHLRKHREHHHQIRQPDEVAPH